MRLITFLIIIGTICSFSTLSKGQTFVDAVVLEPQASQLISQMRVASNGKIYVVGSLTSSNPIVDHYGPFPLSLENFETPFAFKLNSDLDVSWVRTFPSTQNGECTGVAILEDQTVVNATYVNWYIDGTDTIMNVDGAFVIATGTDGVVSDVLLTPFELSQPAGITALDGNSVLVNDETNVAKMSLSGGLIWQFHIGSGAPQYLSATTDGLGSCYVVGFYNSNSPLNVGTDTVLPPVSNYAGYVFKLSPNGGFQWIRTFPTSVSRPFGVNYIAQNDRLIIGGSFEEWLVEPNGDTVWSNGTTDGFLLSYTSGGQLADVVTFGGDVVDPTGLMERVMKMEVDPVTGDLFATGKFYGGNAVIGEVPVSSGSKLMKFDQDLNLMWYKGMGLGAGQNAVLAVDVNHDILVGGHVNFIGDPIMLDDIELVSTTGGWNGTFVVARLRDDSTHTLITGRVYVDENQNGTYESSEYLAANWPVFSDQTVSYCSNQGLYSFDLEEGTYPLHALSNTYYTSDPGSVNVVSDQSTFHITQDFRLIPNGELYDVSVDVSADGLPIPGFGQRFVITVRNIGNQVTDALVEFTLDSELVTDSVTGNFTMTGTSTYQWSIAGIAPFEHRAFEVYVTVPETSVLGDQLTSDATVSIDMTDQDLSNNHDVLTQVIVGSYDPNDKSAEPSGDIGYNDLGNGIQYTIRFQNTGTYPALNVRLVDTLTTMLDLTTLQTIAASHNYIETRTDDNVVEWLFPEINLPDSTSDEPGSKGFLTFTIYPTSDVGLNDMISNVASIYFDFNEPIITNVVEQTVITGLAEMAPLNAGLTIWPNPSSSQSRIGYKTPVGIHPILEMRDMLGRVVHKVQLPTNEGTYTLDASTLGTGVYFCTLLSGADVVATQKLVVTNSFK